jgi:hypothetical protein
VRVLAISGSLRALSSNRALLHAAAALASPGTTWESYEGLAGLPHFNPDEDEDGRPVPPAVADLRARFIAADGWVISSPEYADRGVLGPVQPLEGGVPHVHAHMVMRMARLELAGGVVRSNLLHDVLHEGAAVAGAPVPALQQEIELEPGAARRLGRALEALAAAIRRRGDQ